MARSGCRQRSVFSAASPSTAWGNRRRFGNGAHRADATDRLYRDGTFDLVVAVHVWHHVGAWRTATAEAHRVLRSGGAPLLADLVLPDVAASRAPRLVPPRVYRLAELRTELPASGLTGQVRGGRVPAWRVLA